MVLSHHNRHLSLTFVPEYDIRVSPSTPSTHPTPSTPFKQPILNTLQTTYLAAFKGHIESVRALLDLGANVNAQTKAGATPLHLAARSGNATTVALLVASGADVDAYVIVDCVLYCAYVIVDCVCVLYCVLYCVFYCCR